MPASRRLRHGVLVPSSAIVERDGRSIVFALAGGRARVQPVQPGASFGDLRQVEGLGNGAEIVRSPPANLQDGSAVAIRKQ